VATRIAIWSGPRNISTAMMRSWENRPDCSVVDEPFYACYLLETGLEHPCRDAILRAQSTNRSTVVRQLSTEPIPAEVFYQKHMTHHMPPGMDMSWCSELRHCFIIRKPAEVIASYLEKMPSVSEEAIGIVRQQQLFEEITEVCGERPLVIDSNDVLKNPGAVLGALCDYWRLDRHTTFMTNWPTGRRLSDGVWASHWYQAVETSTGFATYRKRSPQLSAEYAALASKMEKHYQNLARYLVTIP
jgi:hypothetical protein